MHQKRTISFTIREQMHQKILSNFDASQCINFKKCINKHLRHHFASQASNCYGIIDAGATRKASIHLIVQGRGLAVTLFRRMILETAIVASCAVVSNTNQSYCSCHSGFLAQQKSLRHEKTQLTILSTVVCSSQCHGFVIFPLAFTLGF